MSTYLYYNNGKTEQGIQNSGWSSVQNMDKQTNNVIKSYTVNIVVVM